MEIGALKAASEQTNAQWVEDDIHGLTGVRLLVLPSNSRLVKRKIGHSARQSGAELRDENGILTQAGFDALEDAAMEVALQGWDGLTDGGEVLEYTPEKASELMKLEPFWVAVNAAVSHVSVQVMDALEEMAKNSPTPSRKKPQAA